MPVSKLINISCSILVFQPWGKLVNWWIYSMKDQSLICFMSTSAFMYKPDKSVLIWCIKFNLHWTYYKSKWKEANKLNRHKTGCGISLLRWHIIRSKGNPGYREISRYDTETKTGACCKQWNTLNTRTFYGWTPQFTSLNPRTVLRLSFVSARVEV